MTQPTPPDPPTTAADTPWLLAFHSSSDSLGIGLQPLGQPQAPARLACFPLGRRLSQELFTCVESVLPASAWPQLGRLAVATGPGGFTGTRLTVVLARTLAQQLDLPLDGVSSFQLVAGRLAQQQPPCFGPSWLLQELPRHGLVAGLYGAAAAAPGEIREWQAPRLYRHPDDLAAAADALGVPWGPGQGLNATPQLPEDVAVLLHLSQAAAARGQAAPWEAVLPLYPTSPLGES